MILWINLDYGLAPALALGIDEEENKSYMDRPPRDGKESLFAGGGWGCTVVFTGVLIAIISMTAFLQYPVGMLLQAGLPVTPEGIGGLLAESEILNRCQTYAFTVLGMAQLFHAIGMRDVETSPVPDESSGEPSDDRGGLCGEWPAAFSHGDTILYHVVRNL